MYSKYHKVTKRGHRHKSEMASRELVTGASMRNALFSEKSTKMIKGDDEEEDELAMPIIVSDVLRPAQLKTKKTLSSSMGGPHTPSGASASQQAAAEPEQSPSRMRLAVHIRSSPIIPFTPINAPTSRSPSALASRLGRTRGQTAGTQTPIRLPTPDPLASIGASSQAPSSEPKKRGRPKGWKPGMAYSTDPKSRYRMREARAAESLAQEKVTGQSKDRAQNQEPKRRGRPPRPADPSVREQYLRSKPDYIPYKCEWEVSNNSTKQELSICPAELHNMDTLRRHVFLVHGDGDLLECRFPRCRDHNPPPRFKTEHEFENHMETKHFAGYLWHLGEGYQNNGIETLENTTDKLPAYLFDEHGNQVTPSVTNQRPESDLQRKERKRRLRRLLFQQNENAPSEEEWMQQMLGTA
ncbi:hypothetical protein F4825DRAFT_408160 [Nemania diffusa]|nr:hypothetical protein F4825DRAFT_408160 [Nemania diffusa]